MLEWTLSMVENCETVVYGVNLCIGKQPFILYLDL